MIKTEILNEREFINIKELSELLNTSQNTIYRLCLKGDLKPIKFLGKNYWSCIDIKYFLTNKGVLTNREIVKI